MHLVSFFINLDTIFKLITIVKFLNIFFKLKLTLAQKPVCRVKFFLQLLRIFYYIQDSYSQDLIFYKLIYM